MIRRSGAETQRGSSKDGGATSRKGSISILTILRWTAVALILLLATVGSLMAYHRVELFLIRDTRFALVGEGDDALPTLQIRGAVHAPAKAIEEVFASDLGRSIYWTPLEERRQTLREVPWVKDAAIARVWPNHLMVQIEERHPVAFLADSRDSGMIDPDGEILPFVKGEFQVPVLTGVTSSTSVSERRERVRRMLRLQKDLGDRAQKISEINVNNPDNFKVTQPYEDHMVTLFLGDQNFGTRYQNFLNHYGEIKSRLPGAGALDLRLEDRITAVE